MEGVRGVVTPHSRPILNLVGATGATSHHIASTFAQGPLHARMYMASRGADPRPVGWSAMIYLPETPIAQFGGSAVLEEHRGHGVYRSLVAKRLANAKADGIEAVVAQASRGSSAPLLVRLGFEEMAPLDMFVGAPG